MQRYKLIGGWLTVLCLCAFLLWSCEEGAISPTPPQESIQESSFAESETETNDIVTSTETGDNNTVELGDPDSYPWLPLP